MKKYSDTFTQGGQTGLHKFHMMRQVIVATIKISLLIGALFLIVSLFQGFSWREYYFLLSFYKALFRLKLEFLPNGFFDTTWVWLDSGLWIEVSDHHLTNDYFYVEHVWQIQNHMVHSATKGIIVTIMSIGIISLFWVWRGKRHQSTKIVKGYELVSARKLKNLVQKSGASEIKLAEVPMPKNAETEHIMICGTTGSGKTNTINHLLAQIKQLGHKAIIVDTGGGFVERFYDASQDKLLNPFEKQTENWDLWSECVEEYDFLELSESLIPPNKYDSFWSKAAQQLLSETLFRLSKNETQSMDVLLEMLLSKPLNEIVHHYKNSFVSAYVDPATEKTALGIRATLVSAVQNLKHFKQMNKVSFSIRQWLSHEPDTSWLFMSSLPSQRETLKPLMSAWLSIAVKNLMSMGENRDRRLWFIIDELASLNQIPILMQGLAESRKYGGCFVLGMQDLHQLDVLYGSHVARTLGALMGTKLAFRLDSYAAKQMSEVFGQQEVLEPSESISFGAHQIRDGVSLTVQRNVRPLISPTDLMKLDNFEVFLKYPRNLPTTKIKFDLFR